MSQLHQTYERDQQHNDNEVDVDVDEAEAEAEAADGAEELNDGELEQELTQQEEEDEQQEEEEQPTDEPAQESVDESMDGPSLSVDVAPSHVVVGSLSVESSVSVAPACSSAPSLITPLDLSRVQLSPASSAANTIDTHNSPTTLSAAHAQSAHSDEQHHTHQNIETQDEDIDTELEKLSLIEATPVSNSSMLSPSSCPPSPPSPHAVPLFEVSPSDVRVVRAVTPLSLNSVAVGELSTGPVRATISCAQEANIKQIKYAQQCATQWTNIIQTITQAQHKTAGINQQYTRKLCVSLVPLLVECLSALSRAVSLEQGVASHAPSTSQQAAHGQATSIQPIQWMASYLIRHNQAHTNKHHPLTQIYTQQIQQLLEQANARNSDSSTTQEESTAEQNEVHV